MLVHLLLTLLKDILQPMHTQYTCTLQAILRQLRSMHTNALVLYHVRQY